MKHSESTFKGAPSGTQHFNIYWQRWLPEGAPKAVLLVAHGFAEHSGRYMNLVDYVVPHGYAVYALDHRGHGRSDGARVEIDSYQQYLDDLKTFFDLVQAEQPGQKIFLVGHSMGSAISLGYVLDHQDELAGLVLSGGGIAKPGTPTPEPPAAMPDTSMRPPLDTGFLARDPRVAVDYDADPLNYRGPIPLSRDVAMMPMRLAIQERAGEIHLPILIMAGTGVPDGERSTTLHEHVGSKDKSLRLYEGLKHEIFNEPEHPQVMADLEAWVVARL